MKQIQQYEGRPDADPKILEGLKRVLKDMLIGEDETKTHEVPEA
jgi:hypothetical protein